MILLVNVFITDQGITLYDRGFLRSDDKLSIFKYSLASLAVMEWSDILIYYDLDAKFEHLREDTDTFIRSIFKKCQIHHFRFSHQSQWKQVVNKLCEISDDDFVWLVCNDDHIYMDSNNVYMESIERKLKELAARYKFVSFYYSHWPEMLAVATKGIRWERKLLKENDNYYLLKWKNCDSAQIVNKKLLKYWWFANDYGDAVMFRTDTPSKFGGVDLKSPEMVTIIPKREIVRHLDGYNHVGIDIDRCPPLFIPEGFFDNDIKIQYGFEKRKDAYTTVNPLKSNYSTVAENGADLRCMIDEIPLFWKQRISKVEIAENLNQNQLISGRNRAVLKLACSGNANGRGDLTPWRAVKLLKNACIRNYSRLNNIFIFRDALRSWGINDYKTYLFSRYPDTMHFLSRIKHRIS